MVPEEVIVLGFENTITKFDYYFVHFLICMCNYITATIPFYKVTEFKKTKKTISFSICASVLLSIVFALLRNYNNQMSQVISIIGTIVILLLCTKLFELKHFVIALFSISIAHILKILSTLIVGTLLWSINLQYENLITYSLISILQLIMVFLLGKIKRLRNGLKFFLYKENLGLGMIISGFVFIFTSIDYNKKYIDDIMLIIILLGFIVSGFGLYFWIRKSITAHYRERLQLKSEERYQELLKEKELENEKLSQSNEFLAKVVHRDNHLMSALSNSINAFFDSNGKQLDDDLLREIQTLAKERGELIEREQRTSKLLPSTGNLVIDGAVNDLYIKAAAHGIDFNLTVSKTVDEVIGKYISQTDLQTLLCDHIKDAIIAVEAKNENNGKILVDLSMENDNYTITVFDSGVDFEIDTLAKLGKERVTTHADNGGSGIGFMTTFETLRKAYASLMITEFAHKTPFSKSVSIIFDGENSFIIQSYRSDILKTAINRDDMVIT